LTLQNASTIENAFDAIVLGGGAAGLFCAIHAGRGGKRVLVLERNHAVGRKIIISGGGRCNFTHLNATAANYISSNPHFAKSALARFTPRDFLALVEQHNIAWHEKSKGQLFCDGSAQQIVTLLEKECTAANVVVRNGVDVTAVVRDGKFRVITQQGEFHSAALVVATGGLSIPKLGATSFGHQLAQQFGHAIIPTRPGLVPLTFTSPFLKRWDLPGIATDCIATFGKKSFHDKLLFTHRGISGPAILQISSYWQEGEPLTIDLAPNAKWTAPLREHNAIRDLNTARTAMYAVMPQRLADRWLKLNPPERWTNIALDEAEAALHHWIVRPDGTEGYEKAEVTLGGVDTDGINAQSMESRSVPGLYFIGEVVDVTGQLGGYNFQWAWASGAAAGRAIAS